MKLLFQKEIISNSDLSMLIGDLEGYFRYRDSIAKEEWLRSPSFLPDGEAMARKMLFSLLKRQNTAESIAKLDYWNKKFEQKRVQNLNLAKTEEELVNMDPEDREMFKAELGIDASGLDKLIVASYHLLGLISFITAGEKEVRAWTIRRGTLAPQAAGKIHTDFERGFIRADVVKYDDLVGLGDYNACKEKGKVQSVGKDYVMQDGDIVVFKFNV